MKEIWEIRAYFTVSNGFGFNAQLASSTESISPACRYRCSSGVSFQIAMLGLLIEAVHGHV